jgi:hypothetical protein
MQSNLLAGKFKVGERRKHTGRQARKPAPTAASLSARSPSPAERDRGQGRGVAPHRASLPETA